MKHFHGTYKASFYLDHLNAWCRPFLQLIRSHSVGCWGFNSQDVQPEAFVNFP